VAALLSVAHARTAGSGDAPAERGDLAWFRRELYASLTARADALFELTDAVLCTDGPVTSLVELSLLAEHRRGHGAMYDALAAGRVEPERLRRTVASLPLPTVGGRIVLAVDVSPWLRPDAPTSPDRLFCHVHGRGKGQAQMIPGWPYSFVAALETGRTSWTAVLDVQRITPADDVTEGTARQIRQVIDRIRATGQWAEGDPPILVVLDAGYDPVRLAWLLWEVPVLVTARIRAGRVFHLPAPERTPGQIGRTVRHGPVIDLDRPDTHPATDVSTVTATSRYGTAFADA
jgi:hypothetical protein